MRDTSIVSRVTTGTEIVQRLQTLSKQTISNKMLVRAESLGLLKGDSVDGVIYLMEHHNVQLREIVRYKEKGITFPRIRFAYEIRESSLTGRMSTEVVCQILDRLGFREPGEDEGDVPIGWYEVIETFNEVLGPKSLYPLHLVLHTIDREFGGNVQRAYHMALEEPARFRQICFGYRDRLDGESKELYEESS